jgi:hypothetical protein
VLDWIYEPCPCERVHVRVARGKVKLRGVPEECDVRYLHAADRDEACRVAVRAVVEFGFAEARVVDRTRDDELIRVYAELTGLGNRVVEQRLTRQIRRGKVRWSDRRVRVG